MLRKNYLIQHLSMNELYNDIGHYTIPSGCYGCDRIVT
jgi:hypothetical protein